MIHFNNIKVHCVKVVVNLKPLFLNKGYLFENKTYCLDKIDQFRLGVYLYSYKKENYNFLL